MGVPKKENQSRKQNNYQKKPKTKQTKKTPKPNQTKQKTYKKTP